MLTIVQNKNWNQQKHPSLIIEDSAKTAIKNANKIVITILFDYESVKNALNDAKEELKNKLILQMSTISVQESLELHKFTIECGGEFIEAPVIGTNTVVMAAKLKVLIGTTEQQFKFISPYIAPIGSTMYIGEVGKASSIKLCFNSLVVSLTTCFANSVSLVEQFGINPKTFMELLRGGAFYFPYMDIKFPRFENHKYDDPNFTIPGALKDIQLVEQEAKSKGVQSGIFQCIADILELAKNTIPNAENIDFAALFEVMSKTKK